MTHSADVRLRTGFWRFGSIAVRLVLDDAGRLSITSIDPSTGQPNSLIVSAQLDHITATASSSVITLEMDGNRHRVDFAGRDWARRVAEWMGILTAAGLPVPYRSMKPVFTVLIVVALAVLFVPYLLSLTFALLGLIVRSIYGLDP